MKQLGGHALGQIAKMQQRLSQAQKEISVAVFTGVAGGSVVEATINGDGVLKTLVLKDSLQGENLETIADLVVAANNDAHRQREEFSKAKLKSAAGGVLPFGMSIPGLG